MPAKVSVNIRPTVTAGLANDVEDVNQYAAPIHAATAAGTSADRSLRTSAKITRTSPDVATISPTSTPVPVRSVVAIAGDDVEHGVRQHRSRDAAGELRRGVGRDLERWSGSVGPAGQESFGDGHDRVEMGS